MSRVVTPHGGNIYAIARAHGIQPEGVLDFSASINPLGWPPGAARAYRQASRRIAHYPEPYAETLTLALAEYHGLDPAAVLVGNGSTQLIYLLARVLSARRVLCVAPLFSEHVVAFQQHGAQVDYFPLRPPQFDLPVDEVRASLAHHWDVLVLTNPNSPTGALVSHEQMQHLVHMCARAGTTLLLDETFIDWREEDSLKQEAGRTRYLIVLRSLTKFFALPGLRVGYLIAHSGITPTLKDRLEPWSVNTVAQEVALACLADREFGLRSRAFMERERGWLVQQLATIPGLQPFPSHANFLLIKVTHPKIRLSTLVHRLGQANILIRDCANFHGLGKQFFRVAVRTRAENTRLLEALRTVITGH